MSYLKDIYSHYMKRLYLTKNKNIYIKLIQFFEKIDSILWVLDADATLFFSSTETHTFQTSS